MTISISEQTAEEHVFIDYSQNDELSIGVRVAYQELIEEIRLIMYNEEYDSYRRRAFTINSIDEFIEYIIAFALLRNQFPEGVDFQIEYPEMHIDEKGNSTIKSFTIGNLYIQREGAINRIPWKSVFYRRRGWI